MRLLTSSLSICLGLCHVSTAYSDLFQERDLSGICDGFVNSPQPEIVHVKPANKTGNILIDEFNKPQNFRDVAGDITGKGPVGHIATTEGAKLALGEAYRSRRLAGADEYALSRFLSANVSTIVDLRNVEERASDPDLVPSGIDYQVADVLSPCHGLNLDGSLVDLLSPAVIDAIQMLAAGTFNIKSVGQDVGYPAMVVYSGSHRAFHDLLHTLAYNQGAVIYHCTAGKDRTGLGTAFLLRILGVPLNTIKDDFLASNFYLGSSNAVSASWLEAAWDTVDRVYGNFTSYVSEALELTDADVRALKKKFIS